MLLEVLENLASRFDRFPVSVAAQRSRTIGDAYLAALELPAPVAERGIQAANKALDMIEALDRFNAHSRYKLKVRIGVDTGGHREGADFFVTHD